MNNSNCSRPVIPVINIAMGVTSNYITPAYVTLCSLLENSKEYFFDIYIISEDLDYSFFKKLEIEYACKIIACKIQENIFGKLQQGHLNEGTLFRLLLDKFIPHHLEKVLYLDADIIVNDSINELISISFEANQLASAVNCNISKRYLKELNISADKYFNAGVILFNYSACIAAGIFEKSRELHSKHRFTFLDQDVLNLTLSGNVYYISSKWNYDFYRVKSEMLQHNNVELDDKKVIHYTGRYKPWHYFNSNPYDYLYKRYYVMAFGKNIEILKDNNFAHYVIFKLTKAIYKNRILSRMFYWYRQKLRT